MRIFIIIFALMLSGCGYHLRGSAPKPEAIVGLSGNISYYLEDEHRENIQLLKAALKRFQTKFSDDRLSADYIISIGTLQTKRDIGFVSGVTGRVSQYQLTVVIPITVISHDGSVVLAKEYTDVTAYTPDQAIIIGEDARERIIIQSARDNLINRIAGTIVRLQ